MKIFQITQVILLTTFFICFSSVSNHSTFERTNNSEDYYGDLDLKSIRKSELLAGLANADSRGKAGLAKTKSKE
jgi:hypothetical protein